MEYIKASLTITGGEKVLPLFYTLLEQGVTVSGNTGRDLRSFLSDCLGVNDHYLDNRIQTVFLNGRPVDNLNAAVVRESCRIAVSAAMPGLMGATLRKGGPLSTMRKEITAVKDSDTCTNENCLIELRAYNLLRKEVGPHLFRHGVGVKGSRLGEIIKAHWESLDKGAEEILWNGKTVDTAQLAGMSWDDLDVLLVVV